MWWRSKRDNTKSKFYTTEKQLQIGKSVISSISAATSLGCILDSKLNMSQHVSRVCKSANYYLHCIRKIRNFISMDACKLLVHTLVMVRLDYCVARSYRFGLDDKSQHSRSDNIMDDVLLLTYSSCYDSNSLLTIRFKYKFKFQFKL